jgi:hypothetical protein
VDRLIDGIDQATVDVLRRSLWTTTTATTTTRIS